MTGPFINLKNGKTIAIKSIAVLILSIVFGLVIPGLISARGGVFYESTLISRMPVKAQNEVRDTKKTRGVTFRKA